MTEDLPSDPLLRRALATFASLYATESPSQAMRVASRALLERSGYGGGTPALDAISNAIGARLEVDVDGSLAGLSVDARGYVIGIRPGALNRNRYPLGHEFGHILLFEALGDQPDLVRRLAHGRADAEIERLCDIAAAELLMPTLDFASATLSEPLTAGHIGRLRRRYVVSTRSLAIRLTEIVPQMRVALLNRVDDTIGGGEILEVTNYGRASGLSLPRRLTRRSMQPDAISRADRDGRAVLGRLTIQRQGRKSLLARAVVVSDLHGSAGQELFSFVDVRATRRGDLQVDYLMGYQRLDAPLEPCGLLFERATRAA